VTASPRSSGQAARRTQLAQVALGIGLAAASFLIQLGLDEVISPEPWLIITFVAVLTATVIGGTVGGVIAALATWVLDSLVTPGIVDDPATALQPLVDGVNSGVAFLVGVLLSGRRSRGETSAERRADRAAVEISATGRQLDIVAGSIEELAASRSGTQVADVICRRLVDLFEPASAGVYLRASSTAFVARARHDPEHRGVPDALDVRQDDAVAGAARSGRWSEDDGRVVIPLGHGPTSEGVVVLDGPRAGLDARSRIVAGGIATLGAEALERERLGSLGAVARHEAAIGASRMAGFSRLSADLAGAMTVEVIGRLFVDYAIGGLGADVGLLYAFDHRDGKLQLVQARGYPVGLAERDAELALDAAGPVTQAARTRLPVEIPSPAAWRTAFPNSSDLPQMTGTRSLVAWPLGDAERIDGAVLVGWATEGAPGSEDRAVLAAIAGQAGQALERARLHAREREAHQMQEAFIGVISHELRTPITTILGGSRLLRRRLGGNAAAEEMAADIESEADRLSRIVEDLLVLSRLERRNLALAREPVHLAHVVERIVESEARRWPSTNFVPPPRAKVRVVRGEETYVEQVLRNLLSNAAKYAPRGSTVQVVVENADRGVAVRVLDEGPGIARQEVEKLFSLFYRSPSTAASAAGAGIGLFVSRRLVDEMGGRMWARRRSGGGSEFGFWLTEYAIDDDDLDEGSADPRVRPAGMTEPS
jgi:K+-sensing histidine kinase KdpD